MSGYGGLYWPWSCFWSCPIAGRPDANSTSISSGSSRADVSVAAETAVETVAAVDGRILQTAAGSPERQVANRWVAAAIAALIDAVAAVFVGRLPRSVAGHGVHWPRAVGARGTTTRIIARPTRPRAVRRAYTPGAVTSGYRVSGPVAAVSTGTGHGYRAAAVIAVLLEEWRPARDPFSRTPRNGGAFVSARRYRGARHSSSGCRGTLARGVVFGAKCVSFHETLRPLAHRVAAEKRKFGVDKTGCKFVFESVKCGRNTEKPYNYYYTRLKKYGFTYLIRKKKLIKSYMGISK